MEILYEDNHVISVVKPAGVLSQEDNTGAPDMVNLLKQDIKERYQKPGNVFVGLVHRLDRNVGGTMVFAKTSKGASRLSASMRDKKFYKAYFAVTEGVLEQQDFLLENYLYKDERQNKVVEAGSSKGKRSLLKVVRLAVNPSAGNTLVLALPITGRSHQIRAQLSFAGFPLAGDPKYGRGRGKNQEDLGLWSCHVAVEHPTKREMMHFTSMPELRGVWSSFQKEDYLRGMELPVERIIQWFTI